MSREPRSKARVEEVENDVPTFGVIIGENQCLTDYPTRAAAQAWADGYNSEWQEIPILCPACPIEVRDLLACLHNYLGCLDARRENSMGYGSHGRLARKEQDLRESHARMQTIADAHFATHKDNPSASRSWRNKWEPIVLPEVQVDELPPLREES